MKKALLNGLFLAVVCTGLLVRSAQAIEVSFEQDPSLPLVYVNVAVKAGSVNDPAGKSGLTNFMGEMLIRGTQSRSKAQIDLALDQMGARLDVDTRAEFLIFRGAVLSSQLGPYLSLLQEILTQPKFSEVEMKKLKSEIISGIQEELGHDPSLASRRFQKFLFRDHPYGKTVIGTVADVEGITEKDIQKHYNRLIQDRYLMIVGTGDATSSTLSKWGEQLTALRPSTEMSDADQKLMAQVETPKNSDHRRLQLVDKPDRTQTQINIGQIGTRMTDPDYFPLYLGNYAFGGPGFSAILMVEIRVKRGWSYGANSSFRHGLKPRLWSMHLFPASKDTASALSYSLKLVEDLQKNGITQEQFDFAQRSLVNSAGFMYNTPKKRVENKLMEKTLDLPDGFLQTYGDHLKKLTLAEVNLALSRFIKPDQLAISVLCTAKDLKAALAENAGIGANSVEVVPYTAE